MANLELPHTSGCFVCGRANPHGLGLASFVNPHTGDVHATLIAQPQHIGFDNIIHGGILATVLDEIMVWNAIWASGRACVAAELSLRFIQKVTPGMTLHASAKTARNRGRIIETGGEIHCESQLLCSASAKYMPLGENESREFFATLLPEPSTVATMDALVKRHAAPA